MLARLRRSLTYANVVSSVALFLALSTGAAYAANEWTGANIVDKSLTAADLKPDTIGSGRIHDSSLAAIDLGENSVGSSELSNDSVKGEDVDESSLAQVQSAYHATYTDFAYAVAANSVGSSQLVTNETWRYIGDPGQPGFVNGWSNYDGAASHVDATWQHAAFYRDNLGVIHLGGLVKGGSGVIFHLPQFYCPWFYRPFPALANNAIARITVTWMSPGCDVILDAGSNAWVSLDGISWRDGYEEDTLSGDALDKELARRRALPESSAPPGP